MKTSVYGLINTSEVAKVIRKSDEVWYGQDDDGYTIISDGHFVLRAVIPVSEQSAIIAKTGVSPARGELYRWSDPKRHSYSGANLMPDPHMFDKFLPDIKDGYDIYDTRLTLDLDDTRKVRLYHYESGYIALSTKYASMVAESYATRAEKPSGASPVTFHSGDEKITVLPVRVNLPDYIRA